MCSLIYLSSLPRFPFLSISLRVLEHGGCLSHIFFSPLARQNCVLVDTFQKFFLFLSDANSSSPLHASTVVGTVLLTVACTSSNTMCCRQPSFAALHACSLRVRRQSEYVFRTVPLSTPTSSLRFWRTLGEPKCSRHKCTAFPIIVSSSAGSKSWQRIISSFSSSTLEEPRKLVKISACLECPCSIPLVVHPSKMPTNDNTWETMPVGCLDE